MGATLQPEDYLTVYNEATLPSGRFIVGLLASRPGGNAMLSEVDIHTLRRNLTNGNLHRFSMKFDFMLISPSCLGFKIYRLISKDAEKPYEVLDFGLAGFTRKILHDAFDPLGIDHSITDDLWRNLPDFYDIESEIEPPVALDIYPEEDPNFDDDLGFFHDMIDNTILPDEILGHIVDQNSPEWIERNWNFLIDRYNAFDIFEREIYINEYRQKIIDVFKKLWDNSEFHKILCDSAIDFLDKAFLKEYLEKLDINTKRDFLTLFVEAYQECYEKHPVQDVAAIAFQDLMKAKDPLLLDADFLEKALFAIPNPLSLDEPDIIYYDLAVVNLETFKHTDPDFLIQILKVLDIRITRTCCDARNFCCFSSGQNTYHQKHYDSFGTTSR